MHPFPWHPIDLGLKLALAPHGWFDPVLEWYTPPSDFSHGTYFGLARRRDAGERCGYLATQDFHGEFRECEFSHEEFETLEKTRQRSLPCRAARMRNCSRKLGRKNAHCAVSLMITISARS
jgi:hypothetical protein